MSSHLISGQARSRTAFHNKWSLRWPRIRTRGQGHSGGIKGPRGGWRTCRSMGQSQGKLQASPSPHLQKESLWSTFASFSRTELPLPWASPTPHLWLDCQD